jgi:hypothetical protein
MRGSIEGKQDHILAAAVIQWMPLSRNSREKMRRYEDMQSINSGWRTTLSATSQLILRIGKMTMNQVASINMALNRVTMKEINLMMMNCICRSVKCPTNIIGIICDVDLLFW